METQSAYNSNKESMNVNQKRQFMSKPVNALITLIASIYLLAIFIPEINDSIIKHNKGSLQFVCVIVATIGEILTLVFEFFDFSKYLKQRMGRTI